jgi:thiol-disulfide isomerase/thioredoxin
MSFVRVLRRFIGPIAVTAAAVHVGAQAPVFYPPADSARQIEAALASARKDGRHVLLDFGADWCPDCRVLGALLESPDVAAVVERNFRVVRIDVGRRDKNDELVAKYGATSGDWIPALVVLASDGSRVAATDERVRITRQTPAGELIRLLSEWAPKSRVRELATLTDRGVRVTVGLDVDRLGAPWLSATFAPMDADAHLYATSLPLEGIGGLGRPTRLRLDPSSSVRARGPAIADRAVVIDRVDQLGIALPIYPPGPVTLRIPVAASPPGAARAQLLVSYMACGARGCLPPVIDRRLSVEW